jgi:hypothetical protein
MKQKVFTIFDSKAEIFNNPFLAKTKAEGIRMFSDVANDNKSMISRHPEDYTLFEIGEYDDATGQYVMLPTPVSLGLAIEHQFNE